MLHKTHVVLVDVWRVINAKGGTGRVFCNMANELLARGYAVTAICFDKEQGQPGYQVSKGVNLINAYKKGVFFQGHLWKMLSCFSLDKDVRKKKRLLFKDTQMASSIGRVISELKQVDLFISFEPEATFILRDLLGIGKPIVTMYHLPIPKFEESFDFKYFYKSAVSKSDVVQVLLPEYIPLAQRLHPNTKIICIPNEVPQYTQKASLKDKKIISVGNVVKSKRPDLLIKAFAILKDGYRDWICEWWGEYTFDHNLTEQLNSLILQNNLENRFFLRGATDQIPEKLQESAIFAFPSEYESFGLALCEAQSMGLPVVGCGDCSSNCNFIINNENGFLVDPKPESFAKALAKLMDSYELRKKFGSQAKVDMRKYHPDVVWNAWDDVIKRLLDNPKNSQNSI